MIIIIITTSIINFGTQNYLSPGLIYTTAGHTKKIKMVRMTNLFCKLALKFEPLCAGV